MVTLDRKIDEVNRVLNGLAVARPNVVLQQFKSGYGKVMLGFKPGVIKMVLNRVVGRANWTFEHVDTQLMPGAPGKMDPREVCVVVSFKDPETGEWLRGKPQWGNGVSGGLKGLVTNALDKALSEWGVGEAAYAGLLVTENSGDRITRCKVGNLWAICPPNDLGGGTHTDTGGTDIADDEVDIEIEELDDVRGASSPRNGTSAAPVAAPPPAKPARQPRPAKVPAEEPPARLAPDLGGSHEELMGRLFETFAVEVGFFADQIAEAPASQRGAVRAGLQAIAATRWLQKTCAELDIACKLKHQPALNATACQLDGYHDQQVIDRTSLTVDDLRRLYDVRAQQLPDPGERRIER